jgi:peptidoglycan/LPS O-acetylase OafA/YrhL
MKRLVALDGLRALAVLLVVTTHSIAGVPIGGIGVSIFFVLSGYLITTLLVREHEANGRITLRLFYLRRAARLYPALIFMLLVTLALGASFRSAIIAATYTTNFFNSFGIGNFPYPHTWSLAMEEQFYLLWPFFLPIVMRRGRPAWAVLAGLALASAGAGWAFGALTHGTAGVHSFNPLLRAHGLIVGCLVALYLHHRPTPLRRPKLLVSSGVVVVAASVVVAQFGQGHPVASGWNSMTPVVGGALLIAGLVSGGAVGIGRVFATSPAVWMGTRSYAIYLWHVPLISLGQARGWSLLTAALIGVPVAIIMSELSYRWVERPFLRLKDRLHPRTPTATATPALTPAGQALR